MKKTREKIFIITIMIIAFYILIGHGNKVFAEGVGVSSSSVSEGRNYYSIS